MKGKKTQLTSRSRGGGIGIAVPGNGEGKAMERKDSINCVESAALRKGEGRKEKKRVKGILLVLSSAVRRKGGGKEGKGGVRVWRTKKVRNLKRGS